MGVASAAALFAAAAHGQVVMLVTGQDRFIVGETNNIAENGTPFMFGPDRVEPPLGDFGPWSSSINVPGNLGVQGAQEGGWDGANTITLQMMSMTIGGGGPAGSSGTSTQTNRFAYTFNITQTATYTMNGLFGGQEPIVLRFQLQGPGVNIDDQSTTAAIVQYQNATGTLVPGTYTLKLEGTGSVSYVGPGGNGAGGGGNQPLLVFTVAALDCPADFNDSGTVTVQDIFDFLAAYFANSLSADFNNSGSVTVQDIFDFLSAYFTACP